MDIPRNPDGRVNPMVLGLQQDEIMAMMRALMKIESMTGTREERVDQVVADRELQPLLGTTPPETIAVVSVVIAQFVMDALLQFDFEDGASPPAILLQLAQRASDVGYRCGWLKGVSDAIAGALAVQCAVDGLADDEGNGDDADEEEEQGEGGEIE